MKSNYLELSDEELAEKVNKTKTQVKSKRDHESLSRRKRSYDINESFLEEPSPERSWFLGLFAADGHVDSNNCRFCFRHREICEKVKEILDTEHVVRELDWRYRDDGIMYEINITSPCIKNKLREMGFKKKKADSIFIPEIEFFDDFVRGFFDGDGSVYLRERGTIRLEFASVCKSFLVELKDKIVEEYGVVPNLSVHKDKYPEYKILYKLDFSHRRALRLYEKMYNGNVCSPVKKDKFDECIEEADDLELKQWLKFELEYLKENYKDMSDSEIGDELGRDSNPVKRKRWEMRLSKFD